MIDVLDILAFAAFGILPVAAVVIVVNEGLTWWWIPRPRALREAVWCQP
jgi:hypothetical protein